MASTNIARYKLFINGAWVDSASGKTFRSVDPFTGEDWAEVPEGDATDVAAAIDGARAAFENSWWRREPRKRAQVMQRLADLLQQNVEHLGPIESRDNGKLLREMLGMNTMTPTYYRYFAETADHIFGSVIRGGSPDVFSYTLREPYGVIGVQLPWNTPSVILAQAAAPALAAGNTLVIKPSEFAPVSTLEFARLAEDAGFPAGVINVVTGMGAVVGAALCNNSGIDKIAFTGSPEAGRLVASQAAQHLIPSVMELGGKSPNIVFEDANIDKAAAGVLGGFTAAGGQSCICGSRALIQESVYDEILERLAADVPKLTLGDPTDPNTDVGPFCTAQQLEKVKHFVEVGRQSGARLVVGGEQPAELGGWFFKPTVFADVDNKMEIAQEEIFGPVLSVIPFKDEADAIRIGNDTRVGLAAGIWTRDLGRAHRVAAELRAGTVWVNQYRRGDPAFPFGGYGESGYGRQSGQDALFDFTVLKSVQMDVAGES
jgi:aldehyde dehydrogenase (NAD+)